MVFSFFTKKPEKMVARPSVNPRAKESLVPDSLDPSAQAAKTPAPRPSDNMPEEAISSGFSDFVFSEASANIQVEDELDPIDATAEEAAMLFSNAQNDAVRQTLGSAVKSHRTGKAERLWLMLFDLHRLNGEQAAFEVLGIEFAGCFEKSPPGWKCRATTPPKQKAAEQAVRNLLFQGNLTEDNLDSIEAIANIFGKQPRLRLDLSKIERLDNAGCKQLLTVLQKARKARQDIELLGRDALARRVREQVRPGQASDPDCWLLFLELCQLQGKHDLFEEIALDYAVTFEISPPSWENERVAAPEPAAPTPLPEADTMANAYVLKGNIKGQRFPDLMSHAQAHDTLLIDCSALIRMDFISAGALLNVLTSIRQTGKPIIFRHPHHLVAELFSIVGINAVATVVFANN